MQMITSKNNMKRVVFITVVIIFCSVIQIESWRNYRLNFLSLQVIYINPEYGKVHALEIKKVNRTHSYFHANWTVLQPASNMTLTTQFYQYVSNRFKESFPKIPSDVCVFISEEDQDVTGFVGTFVNKMKRPFLSMIYAPGQKFPKGCPMMPDDYHLFVRVDEEKFPPFLLPAGRWKLQSILTTTNDLVLGNIRIVFEIVNYSSEKQKQRG